MSARPDAFPYQGALDYFDTIVRQASRTIVAQIEAAILTGDLASAARRQAQLAAVNQTLAQLATTVNPLASQMVRDAWQQSADRALTQIEALPITAPATPGSFAGVSREAVQAMQASLLHRLDDARQNLGRRVQDIYAREQRRATLRALLGAEGSPREASLQLQHALRQQAVTDGQTAFVDSAGRRWSLDTYANMAVRTVTREAVVQGAVTRMLSHGIVIGRVSTHATSCKICLPFEGTLVDLGGTGITEYRGEAVSDTGKLPPYHPNCAHGISPVAATIESLRAELLELQGAA